MAASSRNSHRQSFDFVESVTEELATLNYRLSRLIRSV
jgi:hypothetical protein